MFEEITKLKSRERYINGDIDSILKDKIELYKNNLVKILVVTPYSHAMGSLAIGPSSIVNEINLNQNVPGVADRMFFYESLYDNNGNLITDKKDLLSMDLKLSIDDFDIVAIGLTNPGSFFDILKFFKISGIPKKNFNRSDDFPLIVGGGVGFNNPEPYSEFLELFTYGESEKQIIHLMNLIYKYKVSSILNIKDKVLNGINGNIGLFSALDKSNVTANTNNISDTLLMEDDKHRFSSQTIIDNTGVIVANKGCNFKCAFCQLGNNKQNGNDINKIYGVIDSFFDNGVSTIIINSASFTQYQHKNELLSYIKNKVDELSIKDFKLYVGSVRIDEIDEEYVDQLLSFNSFNHTYLKYTNDNNNNFISIAPDFGNERLMRLMKKGMKIKNIMKGVDLCNKKGIHNFHLYFMVGIDGETQEDRKDIARLSKKIYEKVKSNKGKLYLKVNLYIPSVNTLGQRMSMHSTEKYKEYINDINNELSNLLTKEELENIDIITLDEGRLILESFLMRGDKRVGSIIDYLYDNDINISNLNYEKICNIFEINNLNYDDYLASINSTEKLPWSNVNQMKGSADVNFIDIINKNE